MEQNKNKFSNWIRNSITARMLVVGVLLLVLLIPLSFVKDLITERSYRQKGKRGYTFWSYFKNTLHY